MVIRAKADREAGHAIDPVIRYRAVGSVAGLEHCADQALEQRRIREALLTRNRRETTFRFAIYPGLELCAVAHLERHLYQRAAGRLSCISLQIQRNQTNFFSSFSPLFF